MHLSRIVYLISFSSLIWFADEKVFLKQVNIMNLAHANWSNVTS
jgi:hypothetical protein